MQMFEYVNGFRKAMYWSKEKMKAHAVKYSQDCIRLEEGNEVDLLEQVTLTEWHTRQC